MMVMWPKVVVGEGEGEGTDANVIWDKKLKELLMGWHIGLEGEESVR